MSEREHIYYFDYLRILALLSVIFMHTASGPLRAGLGVNWIFLNVFTSFAFTAVPLFFMISGYLLLSSEKTRDPAVLFRKRLPRLVLPLIIWTVIASVRQIIGDFSLQALASKLIYALSQPVQVHFWFMYTLIPIYLISPLLHAGLHGLDKKGKLLVFVLSVLVSVQVMCTQLAPASMDRFFQFSFINQLRFFEGHLCTFFLGYFLGSGKRTVPNWLLLGLSVLCLAVISAGTYMLTAANGEYTQTLQDQSAGLEILLASCIFLLFKQNLNKKVPVLYDLLRPIASLSFPIYFAHNIVLSVLPHFGIDAAGFADTVGITVLVLVLCVLGTMAATYIPPLCFPVSGLSVADARKSCRWHISKTNTVETEEQR